MFSLLRHRAGTSKDGSEAYTAVAVQKSLHLALCLFVAIPSIGVSSTPTVSVATVLHSTTTVRIAPLINGKPEKGVKVEFYRYSAGGRDDEPCLTLTSDDNGWVAAFKLAPGSYDVIASAHKNLVAVRLLDVEAQNGDAPTAFSMDLRPSIFPTWEELLERAENQPITIKLKACRGVVQDVSGAVIPGAFVRIVRKGTDHKDRVAGVKSGPNGEFSAELPNGTYIVIVAAPAFLTQAIPFEVTKDGTGEFKIRLMVASTT